MNCGFPSNIPFLSLRKEHAACPVAGAATALRSQRHEARHGVRLVSMRSHFPTYIKKTYI